MILKATHRNKDFGATVEYHEMSGCCGIRLFKQLRLDNLDLLDVAVSTRTAVAKQFGKQMYDNASSDGYGQMLVSTVAEGCYFEVDQLMDYEDYEPYVGDDHLENFNLGTIMRAMDATPGVQTYNFNSGNEVITYSLDTTNGDRD